MLHMRTLQTCPTEPERSPSEYTALISKVRARTLVLSPQIEQTSTVEQCQEKRQDNDNSICLQKGSYPASKSIINSWMDSGMGDG